jgi:hypothetical protein
MTRKQALVAAVVAAGAYLLRPDRLAREAAPVEVSQPPPPPVPAPHRGPALWISPAELAALPTNGSAWNAVLAAAEGDLGTADVADQDSTHDGKTLACALAAARTGRPSVPTPTPAGWLSVAISGPT